MVDEHIDNLKTFRGERIADAIRESGKSQREIAALIGVTPQSITKWIRNGNIYMENLLKLADITGVDLRYLISGPKAIREEPPNYDRSPHSELHHLVDQLHDDQASQLTMVARAILDRGNSGLDLNISFGEPVVGGES